MNKRLAALFALVCLVSVVRYGSPYVLSGHKWPTPTTAFHVGIPGANGQWNTYFEGAMAEWSDRTSFKFTIFRNDYSDPCSSANQNGVDFKPDVCGDAWGANVLAITLTQYYVPGNETARTNIVFNNKINWAGYSGPLCSNGQRTASGECIYDFRRVAVHELGHALGLGHEDSVPSVMNTFAGSIEVPQEDDIAGVGAMYGIPSCVPVSITVLPAGQTIISGGTASLSVTASGTGPFSYQWYRGLSGDLSNPVSGANAANFTTPPLTSTTSYWVRIANSCSQANSPTVTISVQSPCTPVSITIQPASQTINSGAAATVSVSVLGTTPYTYQWYRGLAGDTSSPVSGAVSSSYTTPALTASANYWVRVTNACGQASSSTAAITVQSGCTPASVATQPSSQTISNGATASMNVTASGTGPFSYQWYRGLAGDTSSPVAGATSSSYTTPALTASANYWVRVTNACGQATSSTAAVTVQSGCTPVSIAIQPSSQTINSGATALLSVTAGGTGPFSYQWYRGTSGDTSSPVAGANSSNLTTPSLTSTASYWVRVTNPCSQANSSTANIVVQSGCASISIYAQPASQTIASGKTAELWVLDAGTDPRTYQWFLGSSGNTSSPIAGATSSKYTTPALTASATYWVRITNACSQTNSSSATVSISTAAPDPNSFTRSFPSGFFIANVTLLPYQTSGYWGLEVLTSRGQAAGGFNAGGALHANAQYTGFAAFLLDRAKSVAATLNAQPPAGTSLTLRFLDANKNQVGNSVTSSTLPITLSQTLPSGFFIAEVTNPASVPVTFQLGLAADYFTGGLDSGGYMAPGIQGFGAFYVPVEQDVTIKIYDDRAYGPAGAGRMLLRLYDANRSLIQAYPASSTIWTVAGNGNCCDGGDNGPATAASLSLPEGVAVDAGGNIYVADPPNNRVRRVDTRGTITNFAGNGTKGFGGDGGPAALASLNEPGGVAVDSAGNVYIADGLNRMVRRVDAKGIITTIAGNGTAGNSGDGGQATEASLSYPGDVAVDASGNVFIADRGNFRIRRVDNRGFITTAAGNGTKGLGGNGGPAVAAPLSPRGIAVDGSGILYISEEEYHRVRRVDTKGIITTIAGNGTAGYNGDGGPATAGFLSSPRGIAVDAAGNLYISDTGNGRVRRVDARGYIAAIAGTGTRVFGGDGGPAAGASLVSPSGIAVNAAGTIFFADSLDHRVRFIFKGD